MRPDSVPAPIKPPRRKRQQESADQRAYVTALNAGGNGSFFRVKTMGTFDPARGIYRKHFDTAGIPDIIGFTHGGIGCFIEVKRFAKGGEPKTKLIYKVNLSLEQKEFLFKAHMGGCRAGVAFNLDDCLAIVKNDPKNYPRHPRTWAFLPPQLIEQKAEEYREAKKALAKARQDPLHHVLNSEECL